jgi:hypothetical protein
MGAGTDAGASITSTARSWRCAASQAAGESDREAYILRAGEWLRSIQNADGGWGESCASYDQHTFVPRRARLRKPPGRSWACWPVGDTTSGSLHKGRRVSDGDAKADGSWDEDLSTGTGFPGVFYLKYHLYRNSFPVLALCQLPENERRERSRPIMRVPLSQVADMATYIAKNKMRPRPEWQKNLAASRRRQSVQDRPHADPLGGERAQAASHDQQAVPAGDDAGAAARLQPDLHRLRAHPRIRIVSIRERLSLEQCLKAVDECDAPMVSICGGEPLLYPEIGKLVRRSSIAASTFSCAPTACSWPRS